MHYEYEYGVVLGRFQIFHNAHLEIVREALRQSETVIISLGSAQEPSTIRNPFSADQREQMIRLALARTDAPVNDLYRLKFIHVRDHHNKDNLWLAEIQSKLGQATNGSESVALFGHYSDSSSYYLRYFQDWKFESVQCANAVHATELRDAYFTQSLETVGAHLPSGTFQYLEDFAKRPQYAELCEEWAWVKKYQESYKSFPYPVSFNTADAVVIQSGHVLLVRRKGMPGKGKLALPGGFIRPDETARDAAIRELKEETRVKLTKEVLSKYTTKQGTLFDYPKRSLRGRTFTVAFCVRLPDESTLPEVKGGDDAEKAFWMPLGDIGRNEENFFEDHCHILRHFLYQSSDS